MDTEVDGRDFVLAGGQGQRRIIIFGTTSCLSRACNEPNAVLFMDGTYKATPSIFRQIYTVHCLLGCLVVPIAYVLLPDKRESTYIQFLSMIKRAARSLSLEFSPAVVRSILNQR